MVVGAICVGLVTVTLSAHSNLAQGSLVGQPARKPAQTHQVAAVARERTWSIMGTLLQVTVYRFDPELARQDLRAAYEQIVVVDRRMSLYRDDSELSRLNAHAGFGPVPVSEELMGIVAAAREFHAASRGAFDVTVAPLVDLWGFYDFSGTVVPSPEQIAERLAVVGTERLVVDARAHTLELPAGARIDLGGVAKGYAVDRAMDALAQRGTPAAMVDLGGNIAVLGVPPGADGWWIGIRHPRDDAGLLASVRLEPGQAVATSGDYERFFEVDGTRYSHILDPRTGTPVREVVAVTVVAHSAMAADALSTAAFVLGARAGLALLQSYPAVEGVVVTPAPEAPASDASVSSATLQVRATPGLVWRR